jgi:hypothetical protein
MFSCPNIVKCQLHTARAKTMETSLWGTRTRRTTNTSDNSTRELIWHNRFNNCPSRRYLCTCGSCEEEIAP